MWYALCIAHWWHYIPCYPPLSSLSSSLRGLLLSSFVSSSLVVTRLSSLVRRHSFLVVTKVSRHPSSLFVTRLSSLFVSRYHWSLVINGLSPSLVSRRFSCCFPCCHHHCHRTSSAECRWSCLVDLLRQQQLQLTDMRTCVHTYPG